MNYISPVSEYLVLNKSIVFSCTFLFVLAMATNKPALAVDGPKDAVALGVTASLMSITAYSAWNWYHEADPKLFANQLARFKGDGSWAAWYVENSKAITIVGGALSALMMKQFCTKIGIGHIDRAFGLN